MVVNRTIIVLSYARGFEKDRISRFAGKITFT